MKKALLILLLASHSLFATTTTPLIWNLSAGYRQDKVKWSSKTNTANELLNYKETYPHIRYLPTELGVFKIFRDVVISAKASYAFFGRGGFTQTYSNLSFTSDSPSFTFDTSGYSGSLKGFLGYAIDLTPSRFDRYFLTPFIGYDATWIRLNKKDPNPDWHNLQNIPAGKASARMNSSDYKRFKERWYGPFFGFGLQIKPLGRFVVDLEYAYHDLRLSQSVWSKYEWQTYLAGNVLSTDQIVEEKIKAHPAKGDGHGGKARVIYDLTNRVCIALMGKYLYYSTHTTQDTKQTQTTYVFPVQNPTSSETTDKFHSRLSSISAMFEILVRF